MCTIVLGMDSGRSIPDDSPSHNKNKAETAGLVTEDPIAFNMEPAAGVARIHKYGLCLEL